MTAFDTWLRQLAAASLRVDPIPPAFRGLKWEQPIEIDGDHTGATLAGSVSNGPGEGELATFAISGPTVADGVSTWTASLSAAQTAALTADSDGDSVVELAVMFRLTPSGGDEAVLMGGVFAVLEQA